jgi:Ca2+-binding RTX toxin-like protein
LTNVNNALNGLEYAPNAGTTGDKLTITTDDLGHTGSGLLHTDTDNVTITVNAHLTATNPSGESLAGGAGNDTITGASGDDTLSGGGGNDLIHGGDGSDSLTGGTGSNTFHYANISEAGDTITDFKTGSGNDVLDIKDLLTDFGGAGGSDPNDFVHLAVSSGNTTVSVDTNGTVGGSSFVDLVTLSGVDVGSSTAQNLVTDGNLIVS